MYSSFKFYKLIALISFLILLIVQSFLVYNTYQLKDEHFFSEQKNTINDIYSKSIRNDKVFPGGQAIIDKYIYRNMAKLEWQYHNNRPAFLIYKQKVCDSIFRELREKNNLDSLFSSIVTNYHLNSMLRYKSIIESLSITFSGNRYISLYQKKHKYPYINSAFQIPEGIEIAGSLESLSPQCLATFLNVSSPDDHSYQLSFGLYADVSHRYLGILKQMKSTFFLSLFSILSIVLIYFFTFRNWIQQKEFAELQADFVNKIRHEFHTPLSAIIIANKSLQNEKIIEKKENISPLTGVIQRQSERLLALFRRVFDAKSLDESYTEKVSYNLFDVMDHIMLDYRMKIVNKDIQIEFIHQSENHTVLLDKFWFATMLLNILDNGIKHNTSKIKKIRIEVVAGIKILSIHIFDNGVGMSSKVLSHIFEKFYQINKVRNEDGLGLGLYYANQCIHIHKWQIHVKSAVGKGSEFIIYIPVANNETKPNQSGQKQIAFN